MSGIIFRLEKVNWMVKEWLNDPERLFMTSRPTKEGEELWFGTCFDEPGDCSAVEPKRCEGVIHGWGVEFGLPTVVKVVNGKPRIKWQVGRSYAIQPRRGMEASKLQLPGELCDRTLRMLVVSLRGPERLQEITEEDCLLEGVVKAQFTIRSPDGDHHSYLWTIPGSEDGWAYPRDAFQAMWEALKYPKGKRWATNLLVWHITFKMEAK